MAAGDEPPVPAPAGVDEPLAREFSPELAAQYLDEFADHWAQARRCAACHTIPPYLMARPLLPRRGRTEADVRAFVERIVVERLEAEPMLPVDAISAVSVQVATALAVNDRLTTGRLHPVTRAALDRMWTRQRDDGSWEWPFRDAPPIKIDEHYGVTFAAIGAGIAPDEYSETEAARAGLMKIRQYLKDHPAVSLHQQAMLVWASTHVEDLLTMDERMQVVSRLMAAQREDGGWSLANLVENISVDAPASRSLTDLKASPGYGVDFLIYAGRDGAYPAPLASDGYATGFVIFVARQTGVAADDPRLARGIAWLKSNQRASGRWFTHSLGPPHTLHYISNAGTAYAIMALDACGAMPKRAD
ncbi:MAG: squalene--hopene cyclase [Planctomycetaceae bacterium]|nr:squalene--hopene cyclase [Planctomycetaceae bacterium]